MGRCHWTRPHEVQFLVWMAQQCDGAILEIGCNLGETTLALAWANPGKRVVAVDYTGAAVTMCAEQFKQGRPVHPDHVAHYARHLPNVVPLDLKSEALDYAAVASPDEFGFVFIDGDHSDEGVRKDTEKALSYFAARPARAGGKRFIVWHDYAAHHPAWCRVKSYLDEEIAPRHDLLFVEGTWLCCLAV